MRVVATAGAQLVYNNVEFTDAKCLMMVAAIAADSAGKAIDLYVDDASVAANKIGTLTTNAAKVNNYDFTEQYANLTKTVTGPHALIFVFQEATNLELDWIRLTPYTGTETAEEHDARMAWWRDAKYGQFIHMGAYSYLGGYYNGTAGPGYSEWIMQKLSIPKDEYAANAAALFNPKDFNAEKIVSDAKAAGQKYIIITSRHHEGFSIYDTQIRNFKDYSLFSVGNGGNYTGPDPLKELSEECAAQGLTFGVYVSIMDWYDPSQTNYGEIVSESAKAAYKAQLKGQVKELIEQYGAKVFFFDGDWVSWWKTADGKELYRYILSLDETCIVNNRVGKRAVSDGDYGTPEQTIPDTGLSYDWESCMTMNGNWGYKVGDNNWKTPQWIITSLLDVVSKGGNLLLNVGPDGNGVVQEAPISNMAAAGAWLKTYGDAIFGADASIFTERLDSSIRVTTKTEADGAGKIYVSLLEKDPKQVGSILIPGVENRVLSVRALGSGRDVPYQLVGDQILLDVFDTEKQDYATVYEIAVEGTPRALSADGNLALGKATEQSTVYDSGSTNYSAASMVDGNTTTTRWAPEDRSTGSYSPDPDPWAIIDLGEAREIGGFSLYEYLQGSGSNAQYRCASFTVSASTDKVTWEPIYQGTEIGAMLEVTLENPVTARYLKIHSFTKKSGSTGLVSIYEWKVFPPARSNAAITIGNTAEKISAPSFTLTGTWSGDTGDETVQVQVRGETLPAFTVPAEVDRENGTWSLTLNGASVAEDTLCFTAFLCDENGEALAADTYCAEYMGAENQSAAGASANSEWSAGYSADKLVDGDMTTRWAPKDSVSDYYAIIDLGSSTEIGSVALYEWLDNVYTNDYRCDSFKLSVSDDGETWREVYVGSTIGEKLAVTLPAGTTGRYLKIHDIVSSAYPRNVSLLEVEIYPPVLSGTVAISGTAAYGQTLTADISGLIGGTGTVYYQWSRNGTHLPGATNSTYGPSADDIGSTITVTVSRAGCTGMLTGTGVTVAAADMTGITAEGYGGAYDGQPHGITVSGVPEGATVMYGTTEGTYDLSTSPAYTDFTDGAKTVYYKVTRTNYADVTGSATVNITKKDITGATVGAFAAMTYTGSPQTPAATVTIDGLTATGAWSDVTNAGDTTTFTASGNFKGTITGQNPGMAKKTVDALNLTELVRTPAKNDAPQSSITHAQYTGTASWNGDPAKFLGGTVYTATLTLTATANYTFTGIAADSFTHSDAGTITNAAGSGIVTITFPATGTASVSSIAIRTPADKLAYTVGDELDVTGLVITATMDDDTTRDVNVTEAMVTGFDSSTAVDSQTLTITYGGKTTTYSVRIASPSVYTITFDPNGGAVTPTTGITGADGRLTELPTPTRSGSYTFSGWYTAASGGTRVTTSTVFAADTTVYAQWTYTGGGSSGGSSQYPVTVPSDVSNGTVTVSSGNAGRGTVVTITVTPDEGYQLDTLTVTDAGGRKLTLTDKGNGVYTYVMPDSKVSIEVTFTEITATPESPAGPFVDVKTEDYFHDAVQWAVGNGVTEGTSATTFSPNAVCTRAQMVTFLWRAAGCPMPGGSENPFTDVAADTYYYIAVLWAAENGITNGTSADAFSPDAVCTRAQTVTFLHRAAGMPETDEANAFTDVHTDAYYADAVDWAVKQKITNGTGNDAFSPDADCTRGQIVTFLYRAAQ